MDAIVSAKIPYEVKNELIRLSHINNDLTLSDIVRRAIDYYISSGKLENEFKYFKSKKTRRSNELITYKAEPPRNRRILPNNPNLIHELISMIPEYDEILVEYHKENIEKAFTIKTLARFTGYSENNVRQWVMGSTPRRVVGWYQLGWVGYVKGWRGRYMYYRLKDVEEIINEAQGLQPDEKRGEPRALSKKGLTLMALSKKELTPIIKEILNRGDWVTTNQVMDELISRDRRFSKMITTTRIMQRLHALAAEKKRKRVDGRQITHYRGLKEEWGDQG